MNKTSVSDQLRVVIPAGVRAHFNVEHADLLECLESEQALLDAWNLLKSRYDNPDAAFGHLLMNIHFVYVRAIYFNRPDPPGKSYADEAQEARHAASILASLQSRVSSKISAKLPNAIAIAREAAEELASKHKAYVEAITKMRFFFPKRTRLQNRNERRAWFARSLSAWFETYTDGPRDRFVAGIASAAFRKVLPDGMTETAARTNRKR